MRKALFLFDYTGIMAEPWAEAGYECWCLDIQHEGVKREGNIIYKHANLLENFTYPRDVDFVAAFPPCDHLAVSGARWFKGKGLRKLSQSIELFAVATEVCEDLGAPYMIENPVSTISTYWRKPDCTFHPWQYAGYYEDDNYTKKTCLWTGSGFVMPFPKPIESNEKPDDRIHKCPPGDARKNFRSATPRGFAQAVFEANNRNKTIHTNEN